MDFLDNLQKGECCSTLIKGEQLKFLIGSVDQLLHEFVPDGRFLDRHDGVIDLMGAVARLFLVNLKVLDEFFQKIRLGIIERLGK